METLKYTSKDNVVFNIRAHATRGDVYEMHAAMADNAEYSKEGKVIKANATRLFPWLIERFVGIEELKQMMAEPADPQEDLIMVLGSYILNHVKGLAVAKEDADKKKG